MNKPLTDKNCVEIRFYNGNTLYETIRTTNPNTIFRIIREYTYYKTIKMEQNGVVYIYYTHPTYKKETVVMKVM